MSSAPPSRPLEAVVERIGQRQRPFTDAYAYLLRTSWPRLILVSIALYLLINAAFAGLYLVVPGSIEHARSGSFEDAFFFSVQTLGTIGYGYMYATGRWGNLVVTAEAFVSILVVAVLTGIVFAKFARAHARVIFSGPILIETRDGRPTLTFRAANERGNDVVEASMRVSVLKTHLSAEGKRLRRFYDLKLERASSPFFILSWQIFHPIDADSPIHGMNKQDMIDGDVRFAIALTGFDGTFMQTIHARHLYWATDVMWNHRFVDMIESLPNGVARMDFTKIHLVENDKA